MKKLTSKILAITIGIIIMVGSIPALASEGASLRVVEPFDFESILRSEEYKNIVTTEERTAALQVPAEVYQNMTTEALLQTVLTHPLMLYVHFANTYRDGFLALYDQHPIFAELATRNDFSSAVANELVYQSTTLIGRGDLSSPDILYLKILIAQPEMTTMLETREIEMLTDIVLEVHDKYIRSEVKGDCSTTSRPMFHQFIPGTGRSGGNSIIFL